MAIFSSDAPGLLLNLQSSPVIGIQRKEKHSTLDTNLQGLTRLSALFMVRLPLGDNIRNQYRVIQAKIHFFLSTSRRPIGHDRARNRQRVQIPQQDLYIEYRLSKWDMEDHTTHPFPTALVDAIAGYNYLANDYTPSLLLSNRCTLLTLCSSKVQRQRIVPPPISYTS